VDQLMGELTLRDASVSDAVLLLDWRNDPAVRAASFTTEVIAMEQHLAWLDRKLGRCQLQIAEVGAVPVGQVRVDAGEVTYSVAEAHRGRGYGTQMIRLVMTQPLVANVKLGNTPSHRIFNRLGWISQATDSHVVYRFTP
jgi:UDP-2,4-diacetamido-2,4,6-trideoxy-beta-L-altropyranose hydrolase